MKLEGGKRIHSPNLSAQSSHLPRVSVITAIYNGEDHLEETIQSIINQDYQNFEFIVVDGGSTDRSLEIIKKYDSHIDYWVSEKDKGIADAFNKGVKLSRGDYINFQGDGDGFRTSTVISTIINELGDKRPLFIATRIERVTPDGSYLYFSAPLKPTRIGFIKKMVYPHQGLFTHRLIFEKYGEFDVKNRLCMDYEHLLRAYSELDHCHCSQEVTAKWRADGVGEGRTREILSEYHRIRVMHHVAPVLILNCVYVWSVFKYQINKILGRER